MCFVVASRMLGVESKSVGRRRMIVEEDIGRPEQEDPLERGHFNTVYQVVWFLVREVDPVETCVTKVQL